MGAGRKKVMRVSKSVAVDGGVKPTFHSIAVWRQRVAAHQHRSDWRRMRQDGIDAKIKAHKSADGAGEAAEATGRTAEAADLFLRAGRSAAQQPDRRDAEGWLKQAIAFATRADRDDIAAAARDQIAKLSE